MPQPTDAAAFVAFIRERLVGGNDALMARAQASRTLDTGASRHITDLNKEKAVGGTKAIDPLVLQTILGPTTLKESTAVTIPMIGKKDHLHVAGSPSVLSLGQLVEDDLYEVRWKSASVGGKGFECTFHADQAVLREGDLGA